MEVSPFLNLLGGTRAATNLVLTQVIISESRNPFGLGHKRLTCRSFQTLRVVYLWSSCDLTFHKGKAYSKPIQRRQYVVFCNLKTIYCYHAIWATMENCFSSLAKNCPYQKHKSFFKRAYFPSTRIWFLRKIPNVSTQKILICMRHESYKTFLYVWDMNHTDAGFA